VKLRTHYIFSTCLISLVLSLLFRTPFFNILVISFLISFLGNTIIDRIGHREVVTRFGEIPVRTPLTHTFPRSVLWGVLSSLPVLVIALYLGHYYYDYSYYSNRYETTPIIYFISILISGILVGPSHMLLDVFTEKGIYIKKDGKWKRFALAHFRYNSPVANGLAIFVGGIMLYLSYLL